MGAVPLIYLLPQVYVRVREGDLQGDGTLIAGNSLALDVKNDIVNACTLASRELVSLTAENVANLAELYVTGAGSNRIDLLTTWSAPAHWPGPAQSAL